MGIGKYFGSWSHIINLEEANKNIKYLLPIKNICPLHKDIFKAFKLCSYDNLKVVILGQDPYSTLKKDNIPIATGIAFANSSDTLLENYSPSLDVLRESVIDFTVPHGVVNFDPSLEKWEEQGVLMLNSALTCQTGRSGSHSLLWRPFIKSLLTNLSRSSPGIVYVLMGNSAQSFEPYIDKRFSHVIKIRHPSFYARTGTKMPHDIWLSINNILKSQSGVGIEWYKEM